MERDTPPAELPADWLGQRRVGGGGRRYAMAGVHNNSLPFCHTYPTKEQGEGPPVFLLNSIGQLQKT